MPALFRHVGHYEGGSREHGSSRSPEFVHSGKAKGCLECRDLEDDFGGVAIASETTTQLGSWLIWSAGVLMLISIAALVTLATGGAGDMHFID